MSVTTSAKKLCTPIRIPQVLSAPWAVFALVPAIGGILSVVVWGCYRLSSADAALMARYNNGEITKEECDRGLSRKY